MVLSDVYQQQYSPVSFIGLIALVAASWSLQLTFELFVPTTALGAFSMEERVEVRLQHRACRVWDFLIAVALCRPFPQYLGSTFLEPTSFDTCCKSVLVVLGYVPLARDGDEKLTKRSTNRLHSVTLRRQMRRRPNEVTIQRKLIIYFYCFTTNYLFTFSHSNKYFT